MKKCILCKQEKPSEMYGRSRKTKDGLYSYCKECVAEKNREWREKNKQAIAQNGTALAKVCKDCQEEKPASEFYQVTGSKDGLFTYCRSCVSARGSKWRSENPDKARNKWLRATYKISLDEYTSMLREQGGLCAGCWSSEPGHKNNTFYVDHDHETGAVRWLLCHGCNTALGGVKDDPATLRRLADMLEAWKARD